MLLSVWRWWVYPIPEDLPSLTNQSRPSVTTSCVNKACPLPVTERVPIEIRHQLAVRFPTWSNRFAQTHCRSVCYRRTRWFLPEHEVLKLSTVLNRTNFFARNSCRNWNECVLYRHVACLAPSGKSRTCQLPGAVEPFQRRRKDTRRRSEAHSIGGAQIYRGISCHRGCVMMEMIRVRWASRCSAKRSRSAALVNRQQSLSVRASSLASTSYKNIAFVHQHVDSAPIGRLLQIKCTYRPCRDPPVLRYVLGLSHQARTA